jgi:hypothetical protein
MSQAGTPVGGTNGQPQPPRVQYWEDFFVYELDFTALNNGTTQTANIQIQGDSDFKWMKSTYIADLAAAAITESAQIIPLVTVQVLVGDSGRNLFSAASPVVNLFGRGNLPFILPQPRIFKAKTTVNITVANYAAATNYNLRLSLIGTKIFRGGPPADMMG